MSAATAIFFLAAKWKIPRRLLLLLLLGLELDDQLHEVLPVCPGPLAQDTFGLLGKTVLTSLDKVLTKFTYLKFMNKALTKC